MFIGHYAPALVAATMPKAPKLWVLFVAAQLVDIACFLFVLGGVEAIRISPGITVMNGMDLYHMPYTHSLIGGFAWGAGIAIVIWTLTKNQTGALIAGVVVVSHWFVDVLVHTQDMTILGAPPKLGLGLWNYPLIEMPLELGLFGLSLGYYLDRTNPIAGKATHWPWTLGAVLLLAQLYNWLAPEPKSLDASLLISGLLAFALFIWLAFKLGQTRMLKGAGGI
jgi:hypothetical protein